MYFTKKIPQITATPPPLFYWMSFNPQLLQQLFPIQIPQFHLSIPHLHYLVSKIACRSHLSTLLHNLVLPLHKITFPSSLKLFFATGKIEPP